MGVNRRPSPAVPGVNSEARGADSTAVRVSGRETGPAGPTPTIPAVSDGAAGVLAPGAERDRPRTPARNRRRRRGLAVLVITIAVAWTAYAVLQLVEARRHAQRGLDILHATQADLTTVQLIRGRGLPRMRAAQHQLEQARRASGSFALAPFEVLPWVGRQVRSVDALVSSGARVVRVGADAMQRSRAALGSRPAAGPARVALVERLGTIAQQAGRRLRHVDLGPGQALVGPLGDARRRFGRELGRVRQAMADVDDASRGLAELARGPSRYLVVAANNGEMRAGSGMLLSAGVMTMHDGRFDLGTMTATGDLLLPEGAGVPIGGDLAARWGWLEPNREWRNLMASPRFDASASLAARLWQARTGETVDGVIVLDPFALRSLLATTGPVEVDGQAISADNVADELLLQQYVEAGAANLSDPAANDPANQARREKLSRVARAVVQRLDEGGWDAATLADDLRTAVEGRHVLAWSSRPTEERAWRAGGVAGDLHPDSLLVAVLNRGGNKLDQFLPVSAAVDQQRVQRGTRLTVRLRLRNETPPDLPAYVAGPYPFSGFREGEYRGIVAVDVPGVAQGVSLGGGDRLVADGPDGPARVVATEVVLERGQPRDLVLRLVIPRGFEHVRVEPSARTPPVRWTWGRRRFTDETAVPLSW